MYGGQFGAGLAKMMTVIVTVFEAAGLTISEETETMLLRTPDQAPCTSPLVIEAAGQRYRQITQFSYLGGLIDASAYIMPEIKRRVRLAWACYSRFKRELYDMEACLLYTSPSPRDKRQSRMPSSA